MNNRVTAIAFAHKAKTFTTAELPLARKERKARGGPINTTTQYNWTHAHQFRDITLIAF